MMAIPDYASLMLPMLRRAARLDGGIGLADLASQVARETGLSAADAARQMPGGEASQFEMRLRWAQAYLESAGLAVVSDGALRITLSGREYLSRTDGAGEPPATKEPGPMERMAEQHAVHRQAVEAELLRRVHSMSPEFFEQLIIDLMLAMGYGASRTGLSQRLGRSGDGGLDGEIWRDELGLERIYLQAKRYQPGTAVPITEVRDFAGALEGLRTGRGVFVTTSEFPQTARAFVEKLGARIALVDGKELCRLMLAHGIGVRLVRSYALHNVDGDYFRE